MAEDFGDAHDGDIFGADGLKLAGGTHGGAAKAGKDGIRKRTEEGVDELCAVVIAGGFASGQEDTRVGAWGVDGVSLESFGRKEERMGELTKTERREFRAVLERGDRSLGWTVARVPFDPRAVWTEMVRLRVAGEVNGWGFRTSIFRDEVGFFVLVNAVVQAGAGVRLGDVVTVQMWPDREERPAELPDALAELLDMEAGLRAWYEGLSESTRREIGKWVLGVKAGEAQMRRAMQMAERLMATRDAERELPPMIQRALAANGRARAGWERMTEVQRRGELMGVFYYQTPEARQRRLEKLVALAERRGRERSEGDG